MALDDWIDILSGARPSSPWRVMGWMLLVFGLFALTVVVAREHAWLLVVVLGLVLMGVGGRSLWRIRRARHWMPIPAVVVASEVGEVVVHGKTHQHTEFYPKVRFRYTLPGGAYESARLTPVPGDPQSLDRAEIEALLADYPVGKHVTAFVKQGDPRMSALRTEVSWHRRSHLWANVVAGAVLVAVACWVGSL